MAQITDYYRLTKPGIVYGNSLHYSAGVLLAATMTWNGSAAVGGLFGLMFIIASACIVNNYLDRSFDKHMKRTKARPSVTGVVTLKNGVIEAVLLGALGFLLLALTTNWLTFWLGVSAYVLYALVYTLSKRYTMHHTLIGTIPGALPAVAGYTALTGGIDAVVVGLFWLIVLWQLPHFYAIGIYRKDEYNRAGVPLLSDKYNDKTVRRIVAATLVLYVFITVEFASLGLSIPGWILLVGGAFWWAWRAYSSRRSTSTQWARRIFFDSLVITLLLPLTMLINLAYVRLLL